MHRTSNSSNHGATVLEIIGVMFLLLVLWCVLWPIFSPHESESGQRTGCLSNEKQLALGFIQYVEDYDGKYPAGTHPAPMVNLSVGWAGEIYPYVKSESVYKCHTDQTKPSSSKPNQVPVSYAYNWNLGNKTLFAHDDNTPDINPATTKDIVTPERTVLLCEAFGTTADVKDSDGIEASSPVVLGSGFTYTSSIDGDGSSLQYATGILRSDPPKSIHVGSKPGDAMSETGVHKGLSNFAFADGHARCFKNDQISAGGTNNISSSDCTAGQGLMPKGKAGDGYAAGAACTDPSLVATFSVK